MRLIDADKLKEHDFGDDYYVIKAEIDTEPTVQAIPMPDNATNGDVIRAIFPNLAERDLNRFINFTLDQTTCNSVEKSWWNALYEIRHKWQSIKDLPPCNPQEPKYCDRNICIKNEYNGISCDECEVTKSQEPSSSENPNKSGYVDLQKEMDNAMEYLKNLHHRVKDFIPEELQSVENYERYVEKMKERKNE